MIEVLGSQMAMSFEAEMDTRYRNGLGQGIVGFSTLGSKELEWRLSIQLWSNTPVSHCHE